MDPDASQRQDVPLASEQESAASPNGHTPRAAGEARVTRRLEAIVDPPPTVERGAWLRDDDYWRKVTYMSATGHHPAVRSETRPLPRPDRFGTHAPFRSAAVLALVIALIILIPVGVVTAERVVSQIALPAAIPGISQPTAVPPTHTPAAHPTATPRPKK